jgi:hypothetical protein
MLNEINARIGVGSSGSSGKNTSVKNTTKNIKPDISKYGIETPYQFNQFQNNQFQASVEFIKNNQPTIGIGRIGEWQEYEDEPEQGGDQYIQDRLGIQTNSKLGSGIQDDPVLASKPSDAVLDSLHDDDEGISNQEAKGFQIKEKMIHYEENDDLELEFKKRRKK